jgi:hypothetical protein
VSPELGSALLCLVAIVGLIVTSLATKAMIDATDRRIDNLFEGYKNLHESLRQTHDYFTERIALLELLVCSKADKEKQC